MTVLAAGCEQYDASTAVLRLPRAPARAARRRRDGDARATSPRAPRAPRRRRARARAVAPAARDPARRRRLADARGGRAPPGLPPRAPARRRRDAARGASSRTRRCSSSRTRTGWTTPRPTCSATSARDVTATRGSSSSRAARHGQGFSAADGTPPLPGADDAARAAAARRRARARRRRRGGPLPAHDADAIAARAGGNPLFLQELVAARGPDGGRRGAAGERRGGGDDPHRRARARATARVLRWASVLGMRFGGDLLAAVLEDEASRPRDADAWDRLAEFVERDPNVAGGFRFRQALVPRRRLRGPLLPPPARAARARGRGLRAAGGGDELESPSALAALVPARATTSARGGTRSPPASARRRSSRTSRRPAFYRRALEAARRLPDVAPAERGRGVGGARRRLRARRAATRRRSTRTGTRAARPSPTLGPQPAAPQGGHDPRADRPLRGGAALVHARARRRGGLADEAERRAHRTKLTLAYAGVALRQGLFGDCIRCCRAALEDAQDAGDLRSTRARVLAHAPRPHRARAAPIAQAFRGLALPIYEELGDLLGQANVLNNLGIEAYYEGRWDEALDLYRRSREARERIGDVVGAAHDHEQHRRDPVATRAASTRRRRSFQEARDVCGARRATRSSATSRPSNLGRARRAGGTARRGARRRLRRRSTGFEELRATGSCSRPRRGSPSAPLRGRPRVGVREGDGGARAHARRGGVAHLRTQLERVRGGALLHAGDLAGRASASTRACAIGAPVGVDYEAALTLDVLAAVASGGRRVRGGTRAHRRERGRADRLGVVRAPARLGVAERLGPAVSMPWTGRRCALRRPSSSRAAAAATRTPGACSSSASRATSTRSRSRPSGCASTTPRTSSRRSSRASYQRLDQLRDDDAVRPWIAQLTRRACLDKLRANARVEVSDEEIARGGRRDARADRGGVVACASCSRTLPEHCREMLDRFFAQDQSYRTIGEALDLPAGHDREPDLALPGEDFGSNSTRGKIRASQRVRWTDAMNEIRRRETCRAAGGPAARAGGLGGGRAGAAALARTLDEIVARAEADAAFRQGSRRGSRIGARRGGLRAHAAAARCDPGAARERMSGVSSASHRGRNDADDLLGARVDDLLDAVAADTHGPAAAPSRRRRSRSRPSLLAMTARLSLDGWPEAGGAIAQAQLLRRRAAPLAPANAQAFRDAFRALGGERALGDRHAARSSSGPRSRARRRSRC